MTVQHPVADWYLAFDDLWELMRVNWQTHNTFTQSGMWAAGQCEVQGILLVVDNPPYRGVLLQITNEDGDGDFVVVTTYGPRCNVCEYQPYDRLIYGSAEADGVLKWAASAIDFMIDNALENGVEKLHEDGCSMAVNTEAEPDDAAT